MDKLMNQIVEKFATRLSEVSSVPFDEIMSIWEQVVSSIKIEFNQEQSSKPKEKESSKPKEKLDEDKKCCYKAKKGKTAGVECGKKVTGKNMCSAHKKYESDIVDEEAFRFHPSTNPDQQTHEETHEVDKTHTPEETREAHKTVEEETTCQYMFTKGANKNKTCGLKTKNDKFCSKHATKSSSNDNTVNKDKVPKRIEPQNIPKVLELKKDKVLNRLVNRHTGLIFKSETEKKVIVGILKNGIMSEVTDSDKENAKEFVEKFNLSYEKDTLSELKKKDVEDILEQMIEEEEAPAPEEDAEEEDVEEEDAEEDTVDDPDYLPEEEELEEELEED